MGDSDTGGFPFLSPCIRWHERATHGTSISQSECRSYALLLTRGDAKRIGDGAPLPHRAPAVVDDRIGLALGDPEIARHGTRQLQVQRVSTSLTLSLKPCACSTRFMS